MLIKRICRLEPDLLKSSHVQADAVAHKQSQVIEQRRLMLYYSKQQKPGGTESDSGTRVVTKQCKTLDSCLHGSKVLHSL